MKVFQSLLLSLLLLSGSALRAEEGAQWVHTPYGEQRVVFDFYFDDPAKINAALFWLRSLMTPLLEAPYELAPEQLDLKVVIHGTEIVSVVRHNIQHYADAVARMRYYHSLGVEFKVCGLAAADYGYQQQDFLEFVEIVPSAITELAHWQLQGFALLTPQVLEKRHAIESIR